MQFSQITLNLPSPPDAKISSVKKARAQVMFVSQIMEQGTQNGWYSCSPPTPFPPCPKHIHAGNYL